VLFGSQARGTASEESDVDVLVVIDNLTDAERRLAIDLAYDANSAEREVWAATDLP
jgi:predicted nucleotidyltransferase